MSVTARHAGDAAQAAPPTGDDESVRAARLGDAIADLAVSWRATTAAVADLASAEARLALAAALRIALLGVLAAIAVGSAWLLAMLAVGVLLANAVGWPLALGLLAAANLLAAGICIALTGMLTRHLTFPALRMALAPRRSVGADAP
jgi:hypothetical protein